MKRYLLVLLLFIYSISLFPQSGREKYDYRYIQELYSLQQDEMVNAEIQRFKKLYPRSIHTSGLEYFEAGLLLRAGEYRKSFDAFSKLLKQSPDPVLKEHLMLGAISAAFFMGETATAETLIQDLIAKVSDANVAANAYYYRGLIQYDSKQYYSAELSFKSALHYVPIMEDAKLELFRTLLKLDRTKDAEQLYETIEDPIQNYSHLWLAYLSDKVLYEQFDAVVESLKKRYSHFPDNVLIILTKQSLIRGNANEAAQYLTRIESEDNYKHYYNAMYHIALGKDNKADSLLAIVVNRDDQALGVLAYLERLKILHKRNPTAARKQLQNFKSMNLDSAVRAYLFFVHAMFDYHDKDNISALSHFTKAINSGLGGEFLDQALFLSADIWFKEANYEQALQAFERYQNNYPQGKYLDKAIFNLGSIYFEQKKYNLARSYFERIEQFFPASPLFGEARFFLAELEFNQANYAKALGMYKSLRDEQDRSYALNYRIVQCLFYENRFEEALSESITFNESGLDYDESILKASILFNLKNYTQALELYKTAESLAKDQMQINEAKTYQALVYYQLKRFKEASDLYLMLSGEAGSPDTYLYLSAKNAFLAKDLHRAIRLYDSFIDTYPESKYFLTVLNELANAYYNLAAYKDAVLVWLDVINRFGSLPALSEQEIKFINDITPGLEMGLIQADDEALIDELVALLASIRSDFLKFELQFMLLKIYADRSLWSELYVQAQEIRKLYPTKQREDIEYLMADALINLNEFSKADSLLDASPQKNPRILNRWAELDKITGKLNSAFDKYMQSYNLNPDPAVWVKALELSLHIENSDFERVWSINRGKIPNLAYLYKIKYLFNSHRHTEADSLINYVIDISQDPGIHAQALLIHGRILYLSGEYDEAIRTFRQIRLIFPDDTTIINEALYHHILVLLEQGLVDEAKVMLDSVGSGLNPKELAELRDLLQKNNAGER